MSKEALKPAPNLYAQQEVESFYRFIYENGLRREAHTVLKIIQSRMSLKERKLSRE